MRTARIACRQENDGMWVGFLEGHTLEELQENLRDIFAELDGRTIPLVRTPEDMAV